jgi:dihydroorotase
MIGAQTSGGPCVNFGLHLGATRSNKGEIFNAGLGSAVGLGQRQQAASVKIFMGSSTGDLLIDDEQNLRETLGASRLVTVHAEDEPVIKASAGGIDHLSRRPKEAALSAIRKLRSWGVTGRVYVCHLTSGEEVDLASSFYREATPHHLFLTDSMMRSIGDLAKVNPPLRPEKDRESLWSALISGRVDCIGSDHAPHTMSSKMSKSPPSGMPGVETSLPLMFSAFMESGIPLERLAALTSANAAKIFRISGKGNLAPGFDADITIIDPKDERRVSSERLHYKCGWTPYEGIRVRGWPKHTLIFGEIAYSEGSFSRARGRSVVYEI